MPSRTGKFWAYQEQVTSANMNKAPQGCIGRINVTNDTTGLSTTESELTPYRISVSTSGNNRMLKVTAIATFKHGSASASTNFITLYIRRGSVSGEIIARAQIPTPSNTVACTAVATGFYDASGAVTFYATAEGAGAGTWLTNADTTHPGLMLVEDVGPSF